MTLDLSDCSFFGSALPEPFVKFDLEQTLKKQKLLPDKKELQPNWETYRRKLRNLGPNGGKIKVSNCVIEPLLEILGYTEIQKQDPVNTREGTEEGGYILKNASGEKHLRYWTEETGIDLDSPQKRGRAYRFSPNRIAQRVLLASTESLGLLTDGEELRILICDPARPESHISIRLDRNGGWCGNKNVPDSYRLLLALCRPEGIEKISEITNEARLKQSKVTDALREQARKALESFIQTVLERPENSTKIDEWNDKQKLAKKLWSEGLILVYRLLFILKLESTYDPARAFSFASTSLWRNTYSPNTALAPYIREVRNGIETGGMLEGGLRAIFKMFADGLTTSELKVSPLGGMLFGKESFELLEQFRWGDKSVASLLYNLLWAPGAKKSQSEVRVHYGALDVEDLGRVYEALLELEPGIATEPMCLLRRGDLEVVVPATQGEPYKKEDGKKNETKVEWIQTIPQHHFYLRVGLGRKSTGSYYTPHGFVRFLVQETLGPQVEERSPKNDPKPREILKLKVLDPAMGSGHFLVEACRYLGDKLYEACRLCDEKNLTQRLEELPDPDQELISYLPSHVLEGEEGSFSEMKAQALCRRMVTVHCLYGVDKNPLAVELAKLALWLESYAEGLPLTFLDHRLICGDSLTGPFFDQLLTYPISGKPIDPQGLFVKGLTQQIKNKLIEALKEVQELEATIGKDIVELEQKRRAKEKLIISLAPFKFLASIWSGCILLGDNPSNDLIYESVLKSIANLEDFKALLNAPEVLPLWEKGKHGIPYDIFFPEVFYPQTNIKERAGFCAILGNPPWDALQPLAKEFFASHDLNILDAPTRLERGEIERKLLADPQIQKSYEDYIDSFDSLKCFINKTYNHINKQPKGEPSNAVMDLWQAFAERGVNLVHKNGFIGYVLPSAFHANQSATGIRELYLSKTSIKHCYSFENRKNLFNIHLSFKFVALVVQKSKIGTQQFRCAFYLHDLEWLFQENKPFVYSLDFVRQTGGEYLSFIELQNPLDERVAKTCFKNGVLFGEFIKKVNIRLGKEMDMSESSHLFTPIEAILANQDPRNPDISKKLLQQGYLTLHEGKTFHQYNDFWGEQPQYLIKIDDIMDKPSWINCAQYYRLSFRKIARSTDERSAIFALLPAGFLFGNSAACEREFGKRSNFVMLLLLSLSNTFSFDWTLRQKSSANVSLFILNGCPLPSIQTKSGIGKFLIHSALRLTCNNANYEVLWKEQLSDHWREPIRKPLEWPIFATPSEHWDLRSKMDAVVAQAYGLNRELYQHVLSTFSHESHPEAPKLCLEAFDELQKIGEEAFCKKYDPYWDIPINEALPKPVIEIPIPESSPESKTKGKKAKKTKKITQQTFDFEEEPENLEEIEEGI